MEKTDVQELRQLLPKEILEKSDIARVEVPNGLVPIRTGSYPDAALEPQKPLKLRKSVAQQRLFHRGRRYRGGKNP